MASAKPRYEKASKESSQASKHLRLARNGASTVTRGHPYRRINNAGCQAASHSSASPVTLWRCLGQECKRPAAPQKSPQGCLQWQPEEFSPRLSLGLGNMASIDPSPPCQAFVICQRPHRLEEKDGVGVAVIKQYQADTAMVLIHLHAQVFDDQSPRQVGG